MMGLMHVDAWVDDVVLCGVDCDVQLGMSDVASVRLKHAQETIVILQ
jgi:hypothetical protein